MSMGKAKVIRQAECVLIRWPDTPTFRWELTLGKTYNVTQEWGEGDAWVRVIADDGKPRNYRREWFAEPRRE